MARGYVCFIRRDSLIANPLRRATDAVNGSAVIGRNADKDHARAVGGFSGKLVTEDERLA